MSRVSGSEIESESEGKSGGSEGSGIGFGRPENVRQVDSKSKSKSKSRAKLTLAVMDSSVVSSPVTDFWHTLNASESTYPRKGRLTTETTVGILFCEYRSESV